MADGLSTRRATSADTAEIVEVCRQALGWADADPNEEFFRWKHFENPFGRSPMWVGVDDSGSIVGVRAFMRWRFASSDEAFDAVRAVDTATLPEAQGQGVFRRLTLGALPELTSEGIGAVFNTPNDKSRPGYLKMGWSQIGRVPVSVRVRSVAALPRLRGARVPAALHSEACSVGRSARDAFDDHEATARLLSRLPVTTRIATSVSPEFLAWRFGLAHLHYRVHQLGSDVEEGVVVFRIRRRGTATEATISSVFAPPGAPIRRAIGVVLSETGADYAIAGARDVGVAEGFIPLRVLGPVMTWKALARPTDPSLDDLALSVGDVELF